MKYFAMVWEDLSKPWSYFISDSDSLEDLKFEMLEMQNMGDLNPNARIEYYQGETID